LYAGLKVVTGDRSCRFDIGVGAGLGAGVGLDVGTGLGEGLGLGEGDALGAGLGLGLGAGAGVGEGLALGEGLGVGDGLEPGAGLGFGAAAGVELTPAAPPLQPERSAHAEAAANIIARFIQVPPPGSIAAVSNCSAQSIDPIGLKPSS